MVSYPHPVIGNEDDVASEFAMPRFFVHDQGAHVALDFEIRTKDPDVTELVQQGRALLALRLVCGRTFYNNTKALFPVKTGEGWRCRLDIDADLLDGPTTAELLLLAAQPLQGLSWTHQHPDFLGAAFDVPARAVLGTAGEVKFDVGKSYDLLRPPLESYMRFHKAHSQHKQEFSVLVTPDGIDVMIGPDLYDGFRAIGTAPALQFNAVVLPALVQALVEVDKLEPDDDTKQSVWCQGLLRELAERGLASETALERAQSLLGNPLRRLLESDVLGTDEGEDDEA